MVVMVGEEYMEIVKRNPDCRLYHIGTFQQAYFGVGGSSFMFSACLFHSLLG